MRVTRTIATAIAVGWLVPAAGAQTPPPAGQPRPAPQERPRTDTERQTEGRDQHGDDREFVRKAMEGNQKEIELGKFAATRASNADVKVFANRMVEDHTKKLAELKSVAGAHMTPAMSDSRRETTGAAGTGSTSGTGTSGTPGSTTQPTGSAAPSGAGSGASGDRAQAGVPARLANLQGAEFDRAYMEEMVDAHGDMVELLEDQSEDGDDDKLKKWAADSLPGVREHQQMARSLRDKLKGS